MTSYFKDLDAYKIKANQFCENNTVQEKCGTQKYAIKDQFCDKRDNHVYKKVQINGTWWMAENLEFEYSLPQTTGTAQNLKAVVAGSDITFADTLFQNYEGPSGRYYTWNSAMGIGDVRRSNNGNVNTNALPTNFYQEASDPSKDLRFKTIAGACPDGWRLPTDDELQDLITDRVLTKEKFFNVTASGYYYIEFNTVEEEVVMTKTLKNEGDAYLWTSTAVGSVNSGTQAQALLYPYGAEDVSEATLEAFSRTFALPIRCVENLN